MGFVKREVLDNLVILGDDDGNVRRAGGIFVRLVANTQFDKPKTDYEFVDKAGELQILSGSATLQRQITADDMGKFFKAEFEGWGRSANGKFKKIAVYIWDGEPTEQMKQWPKFSEYYGKGAPREEAKKTAERLREELDSFATNPLKDEDDDDLPF